MEFFYIFAGVGFILTFILIFENMYILGIGVISLVWFGLFTYLYYQSNIDNAAIKQITSETNISSISNFVFTKEVANIIDNQAEKNATCTKDICVYVGKITQYGPEYELTLLSHQNIVFKCTVQNKCKLSSYIEHGARYLKVSVK